MSLLRTFFISKENEHMNEYMYVAPFESKETFAIERKSDEYDFHDIVVINDQYQVVEETDLKLYSKGRNVEWRNGYVIVMNFTRNDGCYFTLLNQKLEIATRYYANIYWDENFEYVHVTDKNQNVGLLAKNMRTLLSADYFRIVRLAAGKYAAVPTGEESKTEIYDFNEGIVKVVQGEILADKYVYKHHVYYKFYYNQKYGVYDEEYKVYIPAIYDTLEKLERNGRIAFFKDSKNGYIIFETLEEEYL